jgi:hypothetical protein
MRPRSAKPSANFIERDSITPNPQKIPMLSATRLTTDETITKRLFALEYSTDFSMRSSLKTSRKLSGSETFESFAFLKFRDSKKSSKKAIP